MQSGMEATRLTQSNSQLQKQVGSHASDVRLPSWTGEHLASLLQLLAQTQLPTAKPPCCPVCLMPLQPTTWHDALKEVAFELGMEQAEVTGCKNPVCMTAHLLV